MRIRHVLEKLRFLPTGVLLGLLGCLEITICDLGIYTCDLGSFGFDTIKVEDPRAWLTPSEAF